MSEQVSEPTPVRRALADWFRRPRAHGEVIEDRTVSFLELFYDLIYVVLIAQIAHTLAGHVSWTGVRDFAVVFGLIWLAWWNGTLYHELHGGEDGRSRTFIFAQMAVLSVLAVYAPHAADDTADGRGFAIVYVVLILVLAVQWAGVIPVDTPEFQTLARRYIAGLVVTAIVIGATALLDDPETRVWIWLAVVVLTVIGAAVQQLRQDEHVADAMHVTESMAERFGLFTIIVLGEVVVGVADGLSELETRDALAIFTAVMALSIGFGFWWNYFDFVGRRLPRPGAAIRVVWMEGHLPLALAVAAAGAGMVSLVEHAGDSRTPAATAWLVAGSVALLAVSLAALVWTMDAHPGRAMVPRLMLSVAVAALVLGALRPPPWLLALALGQLLSVTWIDAFVRHARSGVPIAET